MDSRDAGLAAEIVFGVLRFQAQLDYLIDLYSGKPRRLDPEVRIALRMGIFQLRYLERIPRTPPWLNAWTWSNGRARVRRPAW